MSDEIRVTSVIATNPVDRVLGAPADRRRRDEEERAPKRHSAEEEEADAEAPEEAAEGGHVDVLA